MAAKLPTLPPPPDPAVQRYDVQGRPTPAQVAYERRVYQYLLALGAAVTAS